MVNVTKSFKEEFLCNRWHRSKFDDNTIISHSFIVQDTTNIVNLRGASDSREIPNTATEPKSFTIKLIYSNQTPYHAHPQHGSLLYIGERSS